MLTIKLKTSSIALFAGAIAAAVGLIAFTLSWNMWDVWGGPLPGYQLFLLPGNLTLVYIWHPLFTEELSFWPKLVLLLFGQFSLVAMTTALLALVLKKLG